MRKLSKQPKGFTLIELLIYMGVATLAITIFMNFVIDVTKQTAVAETKQEIQQNARLLLTRITREIRAASGVDSDNSVFDLPEGKLILTNSLGTVSFYRENNEVYYDDNISSPVSLSSDKVNISQLEFHKESDTIFIYLTVEREHSTGQNQVKLSSAVVPRAAIY